MVSIEENIFGLVGKKLSHSFSYKYFNAKFEDEKINAKYLNFEIPDIAELPDMLNSHPTLRGFNVTLPYKESIIPYLDFVDEDAQKIGAVNVVKVSIDNDGNRRLVGYNSDHIGFADSLKPLLSPHHKRALILGSGGAAKAVAHALSKIGIDFRQVSRQNKSNSLSYSDLTTDIFEKYHIIINATPVGMYPEIDRSPEIPYRYLTANHLCYDLVYNPEETLFMNQAKAYSAKVKNGLEMLYRQADRAWEIWTTDI